MVDTLWWVLGGLVIYMVIVSAAQRYGLLPKQVRVQGPIMTLHTQYGKVLLDRLARPKRFWRAWGNFGVGISLIVMVGVFLMVLLAGVQAVVNPQPTAVNEPQNVLVIPGVNDFLPLSVAPEIALGLLIGLVVHEGGHGLFCRVSDIEIDSMGLALLAIVPVGAFVEPNEESRLRSDRGSQTRMFAAGVTNNFALSVIGFILLFGPVIGSISVAPGAPVGDVVPNSPAANAGIDRGDRITAVNNESIANASAMDQRLTEVRDKQVTVTVDEGSNERTVTVTRELFVTRSAPGVTANATTSTNEPLHIQSVGGTPVSTRAELYDRLERDPVTTVTTDQGRFELIGGAYITRMNDGGPLGTQIDAPPNAEIVITRVGGDRVVTADDLTQALSKRAPGETVTVTAYVNGTSQQYELTLTNGPDEDRGYLGVSLQQGTGGIAVDDFGVFDYPAQQFLTALGGNGALGIEEFISKSVSVLFLPLAGAVGLSTYNFAGFVDPITNFYTIGGPLGFLGEGVFLLANILFWTGWVNINLGFFNCVPAYPLDGGHILRMSTEALVSRLPVSNGRMVTRTITTVIGITMFSGLLLMVFGPQLFS